MKVQPRMAWLTLVLLAGCGQKGPLYLPDEARDIVTRPAPSAAPVESPQSPPNPATEVAPPDTDKDKKDPGAKPKS